MRAARPHRYNARDALRTACASSRNRPLGVQGVAPFRGTYRRPNMRSLPRNSEHPHRARTCPIASASTADLRLVDGRCTGLLLFPSVVNRHDTARGADYTVAEAARVLNLSESAIRKRIARGTLNPEHVDGAMRLRREDVEAERDRVLRLLDQPMADLVRTLEDERDEAQARLAELEAEAERLARDLAEARAKSANLIAASKSLLEALSEEPAASAQSSERGQST